MSEVDFENSLREEFSSRGLIDPMEPEQDEPTPREVAEATPEDVDTEIGDEVPVGADRPRNPDGTFAKREEPEQDDLSEEERFIQERFAGDPAKLAQSYRELERKLGDQGNQLGTEVARLRQELESFQAPPQQAPSLDAFDQQVELDPQNAVIWALQSGQGQLADRAMRYWFDVDPMAASDFREEMRLQARMNEMQQRMMPVMAPAIAQSTNARFSQAWAQVETQYPEINNPGVAERMLEVGEANPRLLRGLQSSDPAEAATVIENLLLRVSRDQAGTTQRAAAQQAADDRARKLGATVSSGSSNHASAEGKTAVERFTDGIVEASKGL